MLPAPHVIIPADSFVHQAEAGDDQMAKLESLLVAAKLDQFHQDFFLCGLHALCPSDDLTGIAWIGDRIPQTPLIIQFLRASLLDACVSHPNLRERKTEIEFAIDQVSDIILKLRWDETWAVLFAEPITDNPFLYFQFRIQSSPAYHLVAARLHAGLCHKYRSVGGDTPDWAYHLRSSYDAVARIVNDFPPEQIKASMMEYEDGEFDYILQGHIYSLQRKYESPGGRNELSLGTLRTYWDDWCALWYGPKREFASGGRSQRKKRPRLVVPKYREMEESPVSSKENQSDLLRCAESEQQEDDELFSGANIRNRPRMIYRQQKKKGAKKSVERIYVSLPGGYAAIAAHPSPYMPGALPGESIQRIYAYLDDLPATLSGMAARLLIQLALHTGRRLEWLIDLTIGVYRPGELPGQPMVDPDTGIIHFVPDEFIGLPSRFSPDSETSTENWVQHDSVYAHNSLVHRLILPDKLRGMLLDYLGARNQCVGENLDLPSRNSLWLMENGSNLRDWVWDDVASLLSSLTVHLHVVIPEHPEVKSSSFSKTFQGNYSACGLSAVERYYVSGKPQYWSRIPARYTLVDTDALYKRHDQAFKLFDAGFRSRFISKTVPALPDDLQSIQIGSWRTLRSDLAKNIAEHLSISRRYPMEPGFIIDPNKAHYNSLVRWCVFALGLLNGIRPIEIVSVRPGHLDLEGGWLAVRGKHRGTQVTHRRVPLLPVVVAALRDLMRVSSHSVLFGLYGSGGEWQAMMVKDLDAILADVCAKMDMEFAPSFYSLRHRFRSDMFEGGISEGSLTYLMGHESRGYESISVYDMRPPENLRVAYLPVAESMARRYGLV